MKRVGANQIFIKDMAKTYMERYLANIEEREETMANALESDIKTSQYIVECAHLGYYTKKQIADAKRVLANVAVGA